MTVCTKCGQPVEFRFMDGRPIPLHFEGGCPGSPGATGGERVRKSDESSCIRTKCPECSDAVYFIRHNGGSVWIDPPLGPPWYRHGCMDLAGQSAPSDPGQRTSIVDAGLIDELGEREGIITGVVKISEISEDRRRTLLTIEVGEPEDLIVLVKGGADTFVGRIVIVDGPQRLIFCANESRLAFSIPNTLSVPQSFINAGIDLPEPLGFSKARKLRADIKPSLPGEMSDKQRTLLSKYRSAGSGENWKLPNLLHLIAVLKGHEKDEVAHLAAIMILEKAEKYGDCSHAAELAKLLSPSRRESLRAWYARFSPISVDISRKQRKAHFFKSADGTRKAFDLPSARRTPFYEISR